MLPERRLGRLKEFTHHFSQTYPFGHTLDSAVQASATVEQARPQQGRRRFGGGARSRPSGKAGARTFMWDLRYPGFVDFEGMIFWSGSKAVVAS